MGTRKVSVILPVLNGVPTLKGMFGAFLRQSYPIHEIIIMDSRSTDGLDSLVDEYRAKGLKIRYIDVPPGTFGHGRTRHEGACMATGDIFVFMTQDALPADHEWLTELVAPFDDAAIGCVVSRHIARPDADPITAQIIEQHFDSFPPDKGARICRQDAKANPADYEKRPKWYWFNTDVCSAIRSTAYAETGFKDVPYAEDQLIGRDLVESGWVKAIAHDSVVLHSHRYSACGLFRRYFDDFRGLEMLFGRMERLGPIVLALKVLTTSITSLSWMKKKRTAFWPALVPWTFVYHAFSLAGAYFGSRFSILPAGLQKLFSAEGRAYSKAGKPS